MTVSCDNEPVSCLQDFLCGRHFALDCLLPNRSRRISIITGMTSRRSVRCVARSSIPSAVLSTLPTSAGVRACGCAHRFVPSLPQHSQSAPVLARRRSRSSTGSSSKSARSVSSGRNTPSPSPNPKTSLKHKAMSESHLADLVPPPPHSGSENGDRSDSQPVHFTSSVLIRLSPNKQHFLEQVKYEMRYGPAPLQLEDQNSCTNQAQLFRTELEIQVENPNAVEASLNQT